MTKNPKIEAIDLFCGIGGLSYGLQQSKISVVAGLDIDESCKFAFEANNKAPFIKKDISSLNGEDLKKLYNKDGSCKVLVGCAPCQPFSTHTQKLKRNGSNVDGRWGLLYSFIRIISELKPDIVSMENVPNLKNEIVFKDFVKGLKQMGYFVSKTDEMVIYCPDYGIPQNRKRLVLLASRLGEIHLIKPTHSPENYLSVWDSIGKLPPIAAGESHTNDPLHCSSKITSINLERIKFSRPGGSWKDWPEELILNCHKKPSGKTYTSVYGRMEWTKPAPTITTQFYNYGTGRFGHPEQNRALSIREGAILQTFPLNYRFIEKREDISFRRLARHIGNAVPVKLGEVIGKSILAHIKQKKSQMP